MYDNLSVIKLITFILILPGIPILVYVLVFTILHTLLVTLIHFIMEQYFEHAWAFMKLILNLTDKWIYIVTYISKELSNLVKWCYIHINVCNK